MKKIIVTGVSGFIGSHLSEELSKSEYEVYGIVKHSTSRNMEKLNAFLKNVVILTCDVSDYQSVFHTLKEVDPDIIVHLAALSPVRESFEKPFGYIQTNIIGTLNIAHVMLKLPDFKEKKLIYASTAEVYGIKNAMQIKEDDSLNPSSPYANTKTMTDTYLRMMSYVYGLNTTVLRCANTYGRKFDTSFLVEYLITTMLKGGKVYIGAPGSVRDYMYVTDHVNAYIKAIEHLEISGEAFNAGTGFGISNKDLAFKIADMIGYDKKNIILGKYPQNYPIRPIEADQPFIILDNTKIKEVLGWTPKVNLEEGLKKSIAYWKERLEALNDN